MYELCRFVLEEVRRILNVTLTDLLFKVCENELSDKLPNSKIKISRSATLQDIIYVSLLLLFKKADL